MYNSTCARCRAARAGGYNACTVHRNMVAPAVVVERHRHTPTVVVVEECDTAGGLSVDLGNGIGVDLVTGDTTIGGWDTGDNSGSCGGDW